MVAHREAVGDEAFELVDQQGLALRFLELGRRESRGAERAQVARAVEPGAVLKVRNVEDRLAYLVVGHLEAEPARLALQQHLGHEVVEGALPEVQLGEDLRAQVLLVELAVDALHALVGARVGLDGDRLAVDHGGDVDLVAARHHHPDTPKHEHGDEHPEDDLDE